MKSPFNKSYHELPVVGDVVDGDDGVDDLVKVDMNDTVVRSFVL